MKYGFIVILFLSFNIYSQENCNLEQIFRPYYEGDYEKLFKVLNESYSNCKENCTFIKHYVFFHSASNEKNFEKIKDFDFSKYSHCFEENSKALAIYKIRSGIIEKNIKGYECKSFDEIMSFLYCKNSNNISEEIKKDKKYFGNVISAYFLYLSGFLKEAKDIAMVYYTHALQPDKKEEEAFFNSGTLEKLLLDMMAYKILNKYPSEKQRNLINKAFEYFPFYLKIYFDKNPF